jgi:hypothetical protein
MRLGLGGGAFGFRGGISTRGIGVGVGPLSAGTSWRSGGRGGGSGGNGGLFAVLVAAAIFFLLLAWPYLLGTFVAVQCGAENPSTARFVVGWVLEAVYLAGLVGWLVKVRETQTQPVAGVRSPNRSALICGPAVMVVGLIGGLIFTLVNPIYSPTELAARAASEPCPAHITGGPNADDITVPDTVGQNAADVEKRFKAFGLSPNLTSANPAYHSVWEPSNWTVVSTSPRAGCVISRLHSVDVKVTKP